MVHHVAYLESRYESAAGCIRGIRELLVLGWHVVQLRGGENGPYLVLCRKDDAS